MSFAQRFPLRASRSINLCPQPTYVSYSSYAESTARQNNSFRWLNSVYRRKNGKPPSEWCCWRYFSTIHKSFLTQSTFSDLSNKRFNQNSRSRSFLCPLASSQTAETCWTFDRPDTSAEPSRDWRRSCRRFRCSTIWQRSSDRAAHRGFE